MNREQLQGNWQQVKGKMREKWGKLTDDDLQQAQGKSEILIGKLTERYGISKEKAAKKLDKYLNKLEVVGEEAKTKAADSMHRMNDKLYTAVKCCKQFMDDKPMTTLSIVAGAGFLLGLLLSNAKRKD